MEEDIERIALRLNDIISEGEVKVSDSGVVGYSLPSDAYLKIEQIFAEEEAFLCCRSTMSDRGVSYISS